jgi:hypothetical protein
MAALETEALNSVDDVCDIEIVTARGVESGTVPGLLIEVPHGATRRRHFVATRGHLEGEFPQELEQFFFVNTDVGSVECARWVARMVTSPTAYPELDGQLRESGEAGQHSVDSVLILRGLVARTFIDCNRLITGGPSSDLRQGLTPGLPAYVNRAEDVRTLKRMHSDYQATALAAYETVCGAGGCALILHTYAPRSIRIDGVDEGIIAALHRAYEPAAYESWERRPDVDLISRTEQGQRLAPEALLGAVRERYARIGIEVGENATYRLHEATMGYAHSAKYPGQVLCMEISREHLADPFTPFVEMSISERKARRMAAPIAAALLSSKPS